MKDVAVFDFKGAEVRTLTIDGEPWFVASDVAKVLGYAIPTKAVREHCKAVSETRLSDSEGRLSKALIIPERDLYRLVMRSKLPAAEAFEEWVVGEVLPTIRKTGSYSMTRQKSKTVRNLFTEALKKHGYEKQYHYINTTRGMKKALGLGAVKKDDMSERQLRVIMAAELLSENAIESSEANGYYEVNPICVDMSVSVAQLPGIDLAIEQDKQTKLFEETQP